jgi:hypothetical protein
VAGTPADLSRDGGGKSKEKSNSHECCDIFDTLSSEREFQVSSSLSDRSLDEYEEIDEGQSLRRKNDELCNDQCCSV